MDSIKDVPHTGSPKATITLNSKNESSSPRVNQGNGDSPRTYKHVSATSVIDTAAPIQSVKAALSKFDGSIDWKARRNRTQSMERRKMLEIIGKAEENSDQKKHFEAIEAELNKTSKLLIELKNDLERAQQEESKAKQHSEAARLQIEKMEQEVANEVSTVAKVQLEVDEVWQREAEAGLESMKEHLEELREEYASLVTERDLAVRKAEEAFAASKEVKQSVESSSVKDLKSKLDAASSLLLKLKADFSAYMESNLKQESDEEQRKELEEVKLNTEKATAEVNWSEVAPMSLEAELEQEESILTTVSQRDGMASIAVASLEAELDKARSETALVQMKEKEATGKMIELPDKLMQAAQEDNKAKSLSQAQEVEAAMALEKLATEETKALQGNELATSSNDPDSSSEVTLLLHEFLKLSKEAQEAEKKANIRIAAANSQIEIAKESELRSLEKLEDLEKELTAREESLKVAREKAEKATEGKLIVEQELRKWRDEQKQQRKAEELNQGVVNQNKSFDQTYAAAVHGCGLKHRKSKLLPSHTSQTASTKETKTMKKKKSLFSRVVFFFSKRKTHPTK